MQTNPKAIRYVLDSYGWWPEELVHAGIPRDIISDMLYNRCDVDTTHIRHMADIIGCPLDVLCISEPPTNEAPLRDFAKPNCCTAVLSRATLEAVRRARHMQRIGRQYMADVAPAIPRYTIHDNPEQAAESQRHLLGMDMAGRYPKEVTSLDILDGIRHNIERHNIFTCRGGVDWDQTCGFVISDHPCVLTFASMNNIPEIHTLLHLYGHLLLGETGACPIFHDIAYDSYTDGEHTITESELWCNRFAAYILMPRNIISAMDYNTSELCDHFHTTSHVVIDHAVHLGLISEPDVQNVPFEGRNGKLYSQLIIRLHRENRITGAELRHHARLNV